MDEQYYEERLNISTGFFGQRTIELNNFSESTKRKYLLNRFYLCMSMGNIWQEVRFPCKPTAKQIRQAVKSFKQYCEKLNAEFDAYCEAEECGELDDQRRRSKGYEKR